MGNRSTGIAPGPPATGRRERKAAETRERIFRAAIELFAQRGPGCVTVEQITERADVAKGTFFNYFPTKEAVLAYFLSTQVERLHLALERDEVRGSPRERVEQVMEVLARHPGMTPDLARGLFISSLSHSRVQEMEGPSVWHIRGLLAEMVREGQERGEFRAECPAEDAALFLLGQYFLALLSWCTGFSEDPLEQVVRDFTRMALDGLAIPPHPA